MAVNFAILPSVNAGLNALTTVLLLAGLACIRAKRMVPHACCMISACVTSAMFLTSYLTYHAHVGSVRFTGIGWSRPLYFAILISHTILAVVIVPLIARTLFFAGAKRFVEHRAMARITLPLWLYVSVTGLIVYGMLYHGTVKS